MASGKIALCVNPMSGRDVRRLAARASNMTHEAKRDIVARVAAGADAGEQDANGDRAADGARGGGSRVGRGARAGREEVYIQEEAAEELSTDEWVQSAAHGIESVGG